MGKKKFEDDGRVIADMSSTIQSNGYFSFSVLNKKKNKDGEILKKPEIEMTKKERRQLIISSILASLVIASVFIFIFFIFILFCVNIWFK